jgi:sugar lactone lactonase YvrE
MSLRAAIMLPLLLSLCQAQVEVAATVAFTEGPAVDDGGNVYFTELRTQRMHKLPPKGRLLEYIPIPEDTVTNCAFGGPDMKTLYVTAGKTLFRVRTKIAGTRR